MEINWTSILIGFTVATLLWVSQVKLVWQPILDKSLAQTTQVAKMLKSSQEGRERSQDRTVWALIEMFEARGFKVPPELKAEAEELRAKFSYGTDQLHHRGE